MLLSSTNVVFHDCCSMQLCPFPQLLTGLLLCFRFLTTLCLVFLTTHTTLTLEYTKRKKRGTFVTYSFSTDTPTLFFFFSCLFAVVHI